LVGIHFKGVILITIFKVIGGILGRKSTLFAMGILMNESFDITFNGGEIMSI
jgi:hypothetical protein